jgi:uncharacterized membrane protein
MSAGMVKTAFPISITPFLHSGQYVVSAIGFFLFYTAVNSSNVHRVGGDHMPQGINEALP